MFGPTATLSFADGISGIKKGMSLEISSPTFGLAITQYLGESQMNLIPRCAVMNKTK